MNGNSSLSGATTLASSEDTVNRLNAALADRYTIEREIGVGGMATVYLAKDLKHNRGVALKVLQPELSAVVGSERFLAEIETTANLQHPNILPLFDSGEADGLLFYVMPFAEGESLRARLDREKQFSVDEAVRIATDVAEALQAAQRPCRQPLNVLGHCTLNRCKGLEMKSRRGTGSKAVCRKQGPLAPLTILNSDGESANHHLVSANCWTCRGLFGTARSF